MAGEGDAAERWHGSALGVDSPWVARFVSATGKLRYLLTRLKRRALAILSLT